MPTEGLRILASYVWASAAAEKQAWLRGYPWDYGLLNGMASYGPQIVADAWQPSQRILTVKCHLHDKDWAYK